MAHQNVSNGEIQYTSPTPFLNSLNDELDILIHSSSSSTFYSLSTMLNTVLSWGYQLAKKGQEYITSSPSQLGFALLCSQVIYVQGFKTGMSKPAYEAYCPVHLENLQLSLYTTPYVYTINDIPEFYYVVGNVPIQDATIIGLGEIHNNATHESLQYHFINILGNAGDYILQEGISQTTNFTHKELNCSTKFICMGWEDPSAYLEAIINVYGNDNISKEAASLVNSIRNNHFINLNKQAVVRQKAEDSIKTIKKTKALLDYCKRKIRDLKSIPNKTQQVILQIKKLQDILNTYENSTNENEKNLLQETKDINQQEINFSLQTTHGIESAKQLSDKAKNDAKEAFTDPDLASAGEGFLSSC